MSRGLQPPTNRQMQVLSEVERALNACALVAEANAAVTCTVSIGTIATRLQMTRPNVQQIFKVLQRHGFLLWTAGQSDYRVTDQGFNALTRWRAGDEGWR